MCYLSAFPLSRPGLTNLLSCFSSLVPVEDREREQAEMNETNNPTVRRKSSGEGHDGVNTRVKACRSTVLFLRRHSVEQEGEEKTGCEVARKWEFCIIHGPSGGGWTVAATCFSASTWMFVLNMKYIILPLRYRNFTKEKSNILHLKYLLIMFKSSKGISQVYYFLNR